MMRMSGCSPAGARRRPVTEGALLRAAAYALAACWGLGAAVAAFASEPERAAPPEVRLAEALLATVAPGTRLALRPFDPRETGLPRALGGSLYESVLGAVLRSARAREVTVLPRERLREVYGTLEEFDQGDVESMLRNARADVEVICKASPAPEGVTLSCGAVDLEGVVTVGLAAARFPLERYAAPLALELAVAGIAARLVDGAPATGPVERVMLVDASTGGRSDLGAFIGRRLEGALDRQMRERARREENAARAATMLGTAPAPSADTPRYRLRGRLWRLDDERFRVDVRLLRHRGGSIGVDGADVAVSSLPPRLVEGSAAGSGQGRTAAGRMFEAVAEAVVSERLDRASALRAARNLARARVVAQALGLPSPSVREVTTEADAVNAFTGFLDAGLPVDERFRDAPPQGEPGGGDRVAVRLAARVIPIGGLIRPVVNAYLERTVYRAMEPIRMEIRSEETVHLGVFAWGADSRVVRLYPRGEARLVARAEETLFLPPPGEVIRSAPLPAPGNREDHEALVVVASPNPIDFTALAATAGASLSGTMESSVDGSRFLAALAAHDPTRMAVIWLPYQVHE